MHKAQVINLFGGPGCGKSTIAAHLFAIMKWENYNVELVTEYAKDITWEKREDVLKDQLYLLAKQHRKQHKLREQVDYIITDSPLLLTILYRPENYCNNTFAPLVLELWDMYDNKNYFVERYKPYHAIGRSQTEEQAKDLDFQCLNLLNIHNQGVTMVPGDEQAAPLILESIKYRDKIHQEMLLQENPAEAYAMYIHNHPELTQTPIDDLIGIAANNIPILPIEEYNETMQNDDSEIKDVKTVATIKTGPDDDTITPASTG